MMIDLSPMKAVRVDAAKKRAYVEPGATLADFDKAVQAHGLAAYDELCTRTEPTREPTAPSMRVTTHPPTHGLHHP